jgi:outer membrane protein assembly factor BamB
VVVWDSTTVTAIDTGNGTVASRVDLAPHREDGVVAGQRMFYTWTGDGLIAYDLDTGQEAWSVEAGSPSIHLQEYAIVGDIFVMADYEPRHASTGGFPDITITAIKPSQ